MAEMTPQTLGTIVDQLIQGQPLPKALDAAGMTYAHFEACCRLDPDIREAIAEALEQCQATAAIEVQPNWSTPNEAPPPPEEPEPISEGPPRLDKERITNEASEFAPGMLGLVLWLDYQLTEVGIPSMSDWWRYVLREFYTSLKRWLLARVGRGGGKSSTLERVAVAEALFGERIVPIGQRWILPFISVSSPDAGRRITEIAAMLRIIGLDCEIKRPHNQAIIELQDVNDQSIAFVSLASTIAGVSGPSSIGAFVDEEAKLRDSSTNVHPASEIIASLIQTFRSRDNVHGIRCSSAFAKRGSHYQSIEEGDTETNFIARIGAPFVDLAQQGFLDVIEYETMKGNKTGSEKIRAYAEALKADSPNVPTWIANPTITAIKSRIEVSALPKQALGGIAPHDYWLRENASVSYDHSGSIGLGEMKDYVAINRELLAHSRENNRLVQFDGLPSWDPRSPSHVGNRDPGSTL